MDRVLLAEDEPVSRRFLTDALLGLGWHCEAVADGEEAVARAAAEGFGLLLFDLELPRLRGDEALARIRAMPHAASRHVPAIALTADPDPALHRALRQRGFAAVAAKPLPLVALARLLQVVVPGERPLQRWDEGAALAATGGDAAVLATLRQLMLAELPRQRQAITAALARGEPGPARAELHRLRAACGFCGAAALGARTEALQAALEVGAEAPLDAFLRAVDALLE